VANLPPPSFLIRAARAGDHRQLLRLARELDSINLPTDSAELADAIRRSRASFRGKIRNRARAIYLFCAEEIGRRRIVGTSMIVGKHGTPESPHYYFEMDSDERYSHTLRRAFRHPYMRLRHSMDGPTELGGLVVTAKMRRHPERIGRQLSWVRLLYIATHRARFERRLLSEMLPPITKDYENLFWDQYGRQVTGLSFREADRLSTRDKEFIRALFPESPLYTFLLPDNVRASLGAVGENSRGAIRLLEQAGMRFLNQIDPFDAGPYYGGEIDQLAAVRNSAAMSVVAGEPDAAAVRLCLVACEDARGFRAIAADAALSARRATIDARVLRALGARDGDRVSVLPLG
jgi:arginine N-succinyltransferase